MQSFNEIVTEFNSYIHQQRFLEAIDKFYHPNIISADNDAALVNGIEALRTEVKRFVENTNFQKIEIVSLLIEKNLSVTNWYYAFDHKQMGSVDHHQFSMQRWQDNKIIQEQHFYAS